MAPKNAYDIAIVVPKADELKALEWAFDVHPRHSAGTVGGKLYYGFKLPILDLEAAAPLAKVATVAVVFMNDQGNTPANQTTLRVLAELDPVVVFLVGTAAGRAGRVSIGDVVVSSLVVDAQEWRLDADQTPRIRHHDISEQMRSDAAHFVDRFARQDWWQRLRGMPRSLFGGKEPPTELWQTEPAVHLNRVAASDYLHQDPQILGKLWDADGQICSIDMESGGFASACKGSQKHWLVVRGISDFGTPASKKEPYRVAAAASAALLLRLFLKSGLTECHPLWLRLPESQRSELSSRNFFAQFDANTNVKEGVKQRLGVDLASLDLGGSLTVTDYESLCVALGAERKVTREALSEIREEYFTDKYADYTYENDLRGLLPNWANEVKAILGEQAVDARASTVLDVGIGNGLEAPYLFTEVGRLIGVDVSTKALEKAKEVFPSLEPVHNAAEDLHSVPTNSVDVYLSLRTYQSSLFDVPQALAEAQRVLRRRGLLIISVANGFVDRDNGAPKIVRGLLIPGTGKVVDKTTPRQLGLQIWHRLSDLGFEAVAFSSLKTDIYIWARKP